MNTEIRETNEVRLNMLLFKKKICYTWKNIKYQQKNNKLKKIAPTRNEKFELLDGSFSMTDIHDDVKYITKRHEELSTNYPIHININRINYKNSVQKKNKRWV